MAAFFTSPLFAQELGKNEVKKLVEGKDFIFKAQTASPLGGMTRQLTTEYDLRVIGDSMITYLPYFGRAYTAPLPGSTGGINFTSTDFAYSVSEKKKGGWEIRITPSGNDVRQLFLTVSESGYATLQVLSTNRQSISYNGYVARRK